MIASTIQPVYDPDSDLALMIRTQQGSQAAFDRLVARHWSRTVRQITRMTGDASGAEDLTQEVFFRIYRASKKYVPTAQFTTYLGLITKHVVYNAHRHQSRTVVAARWEPSRLNSSQTAGLPQRLISRDAGPPEFALMQERIHGLRAELRKLSPREQQALDQFHFGGRSYEQIARELGSTPNAIKSLLARARGKLKGILATSPLFSDSN